jgi:hypothetical protein
MLTTKQKIAYATIGFLGAAGASMMATPSNVVFCNPDQTCREITAKEYRGMKYNLADRIKAGETIEWSELDTLVAILNHEGQKNGTMQLGPITSDQDLRLKIANFLYAN